MPTQTLRRLLTLALLLLPLPAFAGGPHDRIATMSGAAAVPGSVHPLARPEFDQGAVAEGMPLSGLAINFQRSAAQQSALETLIAEQNDPSSANFHKWLTPEQFAAQFGMSAADIAKTTTWLEGQGFSVIKVADSGNAILFSGNAGQVHHAFGTEIHHFQVHGAMHYANASAVTMPAGLAGVVTGVSGLDDFQPTPKLLHSQGASQDGALFTSGLTGNHYLTPGDFSTIYDVKALTQGGFTGAGVTIGIVGQTDIVLSDITAFRAAAGLPVNNPTVLLIPGSGDPGISHSDLPEADLDMEWSGGIAPNATIVFLNSTNAFNSGIFAIQNRVTVNSNSVLIPIISFSYGVCEAEAGSGTFNTMEAAFQQAATQGQTVIAAAGDAGATDCDSSTPSNPIVTATQGLAVDYPASSAFVTGIGGTEFNEGTATGATSFWSGNVSNTTATDIVSSALSYIPEMAWNDTPNETEAVHFNGLLGGGGGASIVFTKPTWQTGVPGIPVDGKRDVPDISLNASPVHDSYLVCTQVQLVTTGQYTGSCGNGFRIADGSAADNNDLTAFGGTSLGAPSFSGVLALIEQKLGAPQGLINPALYSMASNPTTYASAFHDITVGSNAEPCSRGTGCSGGLAGFNAGTGYDEATGLGSIDANNLATAFAAYVIANGGKAGTSVALNTSPATPTIGQPATFTATVTRNSVSGTPTGSVTFSVDGVATGAAVPLVAGVASTTFSFTTGGSHTVIASYSGDGGDYASISSTVTISSFTNAGGAAATSLTLTDGGVSSVTLFSTTTPTFTAVVTTASGTISGSVTFTVGTGAGAVSTTVTIGPSNQAGSSSTVSFTPASISAATGFTSPSTVVTAHYNGTTTDQQSTSSPLTLTVVAPAFTITAPAMLINSAAPGISIVTVTSTGGFSDPVNLILSSTTLSFCYGLSVDPVQPAANASATTQLEITTLNACGLATPGAPSNARKNIAGNSGAPDTRIARGAGAVLAALCLAGCFARRRRGLPGLAVVAVVLLGGLLAGTTGCASSYATNNGGGEAFNLPAGSYIITITGTDAVNALVPVVSTNFTLTVQ